MWSVPIAIFPQQSQGSSVVAVKSDEVQGTVPSASTPDEALPDLEWHGELSVGWRGVHVHGNEEQFQEDQNLDDGPVLRDLVLEGKRSSGVGTLRDFALRAHGVGDPATSYEGELGLEGLHALGRYQRTTFAGATNSSVHAIDIVRDSGLLRLESPKGSASDVRVGFELSYLHRDAFEMGTRSVDLGFVSNVPTRKDERDLGARADLSFVWEDWRIRVDGGARRLDSTDERDFAQPSPSDPGSLATEQFDADLGGHGYAGGLRATHSFFGGDLQADFGVKYDTTALEGDLQSTETGILFDPTLPFQRDTTGDVDIAQDELDADAGVRYEISADVALLARLSHTHETSEADLNRTVVLEEFMGRPPSVLDIVDRSEFERRLDMVEVGVESALGEDWNLTVNGSAGREDIHTLETSKGSLLRSFDGSLDRWGGEANLMYTPTKAWQWTLGAGHEIAPMHNSFGGTEFDYAHDHGTFAALKARFKPDANLALSAGVRHEEMESDAFGSESKIDSVSFDASGSPAAGLTANASVSIRSIELVADTTFTLLVPGPFPVPGQATYKSMQTVFAGSIAWDASARLSPRVSGSAATGTFDSEFHYVMFDVDLPYRFADSAWIGTEFDMRSFDTVGRASATDYDSFVWTVYLRLQDLGAWARTEHAGMLRGMGTRRHAFALRGFRAATWLLAGAASCGGSNDEGSANPGIDAQPPTTSAIPPAGAYPAPQIVKLTSNEPATIYYTLDGSLPAVGAQNTLSGPSPITGIAVNTSPTQIQFFGVDVAGNEESVRSQVYVIDTTDPIVTTIGPAPELFGLLTTQSIVWQSSESGTYRIQLGGSGSPNTGLLLQVGSVTALTQKTIDIHGWQLSFGPAEPLWILVSDAATNVGNTSVDLELKELATMPLNPETHGIAITPDGASALISFFNAHEVAVFDIDPQSPSFHTQTAGISVGFQPGDLAITPDGTRAYVGHSTGVDVIDTASEAVLTIPVDGVDAIADIALTPDGKRAYFARSGILYVLDTDPSSPTFHDIPLPVASNTPLFVSANVAVSPDGKRLLVAWFGVAAYSLAVVDVDPASPTFHFVVATPVPIVAANSVAPSVSNDSRFGFVGNALGNLARVDLEVSPIGIDLTSASLSPDATLVTLDDEFLLMLQRGSTALTIARPDTLAIVGIIPWQTLGDVGAITPDGHRAYLLRNALLATQELVAVPLD